MRSSSFGPSDDIPGRFTGVATAVDGSNLDVKMVIDAQSNIFFIAGGFGTLNLATKAKAGRHRGPIKMVATILRATITARMPMTSRTSTRT